MLAQIRILDWRGPPNRSIRCKPVTEIAKRLERFPHISPIQHTDSSNLMTWRYRCRPIPVDLGTMQRRADVQGSVRFGNIVVVALERGVLGSW